MNPFFEPEKYTVKQLHEKIYDISSKIAMAKSSGMSSSVIESMQVSLEMIYEEINTRTYKRVQEKAEEAGKGDGVCFSTEQYLDKNREDGESKNENSRKQNYKPGW